jgi:hypothetical protein
MTYTADEQRVRFFAERARITVRQGETWDEYRDRMHAQDQRPGDNRPRYRGPGTCNCPRAYSLCVWAKHFHQQQPDWDPQKQPHGGWGWAWGYIPPSSPLHVHTWLVDGSCVFLECEARQPQARRRRR